MRSEQEANRAIERYADMVRRLCFVHLKNEADTEDIFQTVFLKYVLYHDEFESEEHEKAWFIRDAVYLHYYEGYTAPEIGKLLGKNTNTVYTLLTRARQLLREKLGGEHDG